MVKYCIALLVALAFATPAFAQDDVPQVELAFGYGNLGVKDFADLLGTNGGRDSGFATHQAFNLNEWFALENYFGYYALGESALAGKAELIANTFGGKFSLRRTDRIVPYGSVGFGGGFFRFPNQGSGSNNAMAFKIGGGIDIGFHDSLAWKIDVSRMSFHFAGWNSGMNISTGIVLKLTP